MLPSPPRRTLRRRRGRPPALPYLVQVCCREHSNSKEGTSQVSNAIARRLQIPGRFFPPDDSRRACIPGRQLAHRIGRGGKCPLSPIPRRRSEEAEAQNPDLAGAAAATPERLAQRGRHGGKLSGRPRSAAEARLFRQADGSAAPAGFGAGIGPGVGRRGSKKGKPPPPTVLVQERPFGAKGGTAWLATRIRFFGEKGRKKTE